MDGFYAARDSTNAGASLDGFVTAVHNPHYATALACGVVCAGHMEESLVRAERREKRMVSAARRRAQFPKLKSWYLNRSGNWQIKLRRCRVTIFQKPTGWSAVVHHPMRPEPAFTRERFPSFVQAQMAAFDTMSFVEDEVGGR